MSRWIPGARHTTGRAFRSPVAWLLAIVVALAPQVLATPPAPAGERGGRPDPTWRHAALWDDGQAEFSAYEVRWPRYGHLRRGRVLLILVKEPWAPDLDVKADRPRPDGFDVLKLNVVRDVPTGIYTYHQMASIYFRRDDGRLVKMASTSSEACGISTAEMVEGRLETHSYFDGEGDGELEFPPQAVPEDALPALLRDYVTGEPPAELRVFPSLLRGRFGTLRAEAWRLARRDAGEVVVPAGRFEAVEVRLERAPDHWITCTFEKALPHRLVRLVASSGTVYDLAKSERIPYWQMNQPGGENWYPESLREP